jgi:FAD/FMN-containing dehydrogenase
LTSSLEPPLSDITALPDESRRQPIVNALLGEIGPRHAFVTDAEQAPYECDGLSMFGARPIAVVLPETASEVAGTLTLCDRLKTPVVAHGAGTYSLLHPDASRTLGTSRISALTAGAPQEVLSAIVGCLVHLESLAQAGAPVRHWIEWIDFPLSGCAHKPQESTSNDHYE